MKFNEKLRALRQRNGLTQKELSHQLNVDRSTYSYYEIGKSEPPIKTLVRLSEVFNVSLDVLLNNEKSLS